MPWRHERSILTDGIPGCLLPDAPTLSVASLVRLEELEKCVMLQIFGSVESIFSRRLLRQLQAADLNAALLCKRMSFRRPG